MNDLEIECGQPKVPMHDEIISVIYVNQPDNRLVVRRNGALKARAEGEGETNICETGKLRSRVLSFDVRE